MCLTFAYPTTRHPAIDPANSFVSRSSQISHCPEGLLEERRKVVVVVAAEEVAHSV